MSQTVIKTELEFLNGYKILQDSLCSTVSKTEDAAHVVVTMR